MRVLVTGGTGYIGSHVSVELLRAGHELVIVDSLVNSRKSVLERIGEIAGRDARFYKADLRDQSRMAMIFRENHFDAAIHLADLKSAEASVEKPLLYYDNNLQGFLVLAEQMQKHGVRKLVFSSSASVYGRQGIIPCQETMPVAPLHPYGWSKVFVERILADLCRTEEPWRVCVLRYFNPIGAHGSALIGEDPAEVGSNLFPHIMKVAAGEMPELPVYGGDYATPDGTAVRDYLHVLDLAAGHLHALEYLATHRGMEIINLGTGRGTSVLELLRTFERVNACRVPYYITERRPGDVDVCRADVHKAEQCLGWRAKRSLEDMCRDGWRFYCRAYGRMG